MTASWTNCSTVGRLRNRGLGRNNTSGVIGVSWCKKRGKWYAQIMRHGRKIHLGYFTTLEDATLNEIRACWLYFPEGKKLVDRIEAIYSEPKQAELRKAVLLSAIIAVLERLL